MISSSSSVMAAEVVMLVVMVIVEVCRGRGQQQRGRDGQ
jgi:hypothetical protein